MSGIRGVVRFRDLELDVAAYELRRNGRRIRLERHPMDLLILLVERRGELVPRADIIDRLWGKDVFVDVETGVHTAMRKLRLALRDTAENPTFVETVPGPRVSLCRARRAARETGGARQTRPLRLSSRPPLNLP